MFNLAKKETVERKVIIEHVWFDMAQWSRCFCFYCSSSRCRHLIVYDYIFMKTANRIEFQKEACSLSRTDPIRRNKCETKSIMIEYYINDVVHSNSNIASALPLSFELSCLDKNSIFDVHEWFCKNESMYMSFGIPQYWLYMKKSLQYCFHVSNGVHIHSRMKKKKFFSDVHSKRYKHMKSNA